MWIETTGWKPLNGPDTFTFWDNRTFDQFLSIGLSNDDWNWWSLITVVNNSSRCFYSLLVDAIGFMFVCLFVYHLSPAQNSATHNCFFALCMPSWVGFPVTESLLRSIWATLSDQLGTICLVQYVRSNQNCIPLLLPWKACYFMINIS